MNTAVPSYHNRKVDQGEVLIGSLEVGAEVQVRLPNATAYRVARILGVRPAPSGETTPSGAIYLDRLVHRGGHTYLGDFNCSGGFTTVLTGPLPSRPVACTNSVPADAAV